MRTRFYISSSNKDISDIQGLKKYLETIDHNNQVVIHSKEDIYIGENKNRKVYQFIKSSSIIICIITIDYLRECKNEILEIFNNEDEKIIIPILFKPCNIEDSNFDGLKILILEEFNEKYPNKGTDAFWNSVSEQVRSRYKNELKQREQIEEERVLSAYAGYAVNSDLRILQLNLDEKNLNQRIDKLNKGELKIRVIGESMTPNIQNNDLLTCQLIDTNIKIIKSSRKELTPDFKQNKYYVIETRDQGIMIKYIQFVDNKVILISTNSLYQPVILLPNEIISIWEVTSLHRSL